PVPPDTDARAYLLSIRGQVAAPARSVTADETPPSPAELVGVSSGSSGGAPTFDLASWQREREAEFAAWDASRGGRRYASRYGDDPPPHSDGPAAAIWDAPEAPPMMAIPAGNFVMGSPPGERGRKVTEGPQHNVRIPRAFALSRDLVTFDEWDAFAAEGACGGYFPADEHWG